MLVGRDDERAMVERLVAAAADGRSGALVIRGEAGIGKSALLSHASSVAQGMRVLYAVGVESEAELAFGALHLMLYPYLERLDALPDPQATALRTAFGLVDAPAPDRFLIGAGTLTLLAELATETPLLCLIDDAQWLDQGSSDALLFAARRFYADPIAMLFGVRETAVPFPTSGVDTLQLTGLPPTAAAALLDEREPNLAAPVRNRVLEDAGGNPLAILEFGAARETAQREGHADPVAQVGPLPVTHRVQETFAQQITHLPARTKQLLLVAAADGTAGLPTVLRVAGSLGASAADLEPAERAQLVSASTDDVTFRHPLIRAAAYQGAPHHQRIAVHRAFAEALSGTVDADRRAWHLAAAASGPDEDVAEELERTALRAEQRGGMMAVSAAYDRAGRLSTDPERKARRFAKAAWAAYGAGKPDRAVRLATEASSLSADPGITARAMFVRAQVECERTSSIADATLALDAAACIFDSDPESAAGMLTEAFIAARNACAHDLIRQCVRHLRALRLPEDSELLPRIAGDAGWVDILDGRPELAVTPMRALVEEARSRPIDNLHCIIAGFSSLILADDASTEALRFMLDAGRERGALLWMPYALDIMAVGHLMGGKFFEAENCVAEAVPMAEEFGMETELVALRAVSVWLAAVYGDESGCRWLAEEVLPRLAERHPMNGALASWGLGMLDLSIGRLDTALDTLDGVCAGPAGRDFLIRAVPDHVEAAVRAGRPERARDHLPRFDHWAEHIGAPLGRALALRCHALLDDGGGAEEMYSAASRIQQDHGGSYDRARTQLLYGEWLRRRRRRGDARTQLVAALETFEQLGARRWAERAGAELAVIGERPTAQPHETDLAKRLTPQELHVVRLAETGLSNKEIGAQLFLSARTVGHHLYKAYPKLGVTKRIELAQLDL